MYFSLMNEEHKDRFSTSNSWWDLNSRLHDQRANDISTELKSSMKALSNSPKSYSPRLSSHLTFCVLVMLSLLQHHNYLYIFLMNDKHRDRFFNKWQTTVDGIWTQDCMIKEPTRFHWAKELNERHFSEGTPHSHRFGACFSLVGLCVWRLHNIFKGRILEVKGRLKPS